MTVSTEALDRLKAREKAACAAWESALAEARANKAGNTPEVVATAKAHVVACAELRMARQGLVRPLTPADATECGRCGGYGGAAQWPGFVCFDCEGRGWKD